MTIVIMDKFHRHIRRKSRELAENIHDQLDMTTPVDTGLAVSNWIFSTRERDDVVGDKENVESSAGTDSVIDVIPDWDPFKGELFLINNVPYIRRLNEGYSPQAPPGFVEDAVATAVALTNYKA